jgi:hypothetical protein
MTQTGGVYPVRQTLLLKAAVALRGRFFYLLGRIIFA